MTSILGRRCRHQWILSENTLPSSPWSFNWQLGSTKAKICFPSQISLTGFSLWNPVLCKMSISLFQKTFDTGSLVPDQQTWFGSLVKESQWIISEKKSQSLYFKTYLCKTGSLILDPIRLAKLICFTCQRKSKLSFKSDRKDTPCKHQ